VELNKGFKQTEIGVIPNDWDVRQFADLMTFQNGVNADKSSYGKGTPFVNVLEVITKSHIYKSDVNGLVILNRNQLESFSVKKGDLLFNRTSETQEEVGLTSVYLDEESIVFGGFVIRGRPINCSKLNANYSGYGLRAPIIRKQIISIGQGVVRANIGQADLKKVLVAVPPLKEQEAIAKTLSDTDAYIISIEKIIEKKRLIKKGVMSELITGKKRLTGFSRPWSRKKLKDVCQSFTTGKLDANAMVTDGDYPFFTCAREQYKIDRFAFDDEALLVSGNGANVGYIHYYKGKFNAYQRTYVLTGFKANIHFVRLFMDMNLKERIRIEVNAGNTPYITMDTLTEMDIFLPDEIKEQNEIAAILLNIDSDLLSLEAKLSKARLLKHGMIQELLTGRIRLV
jgi:type I restriction enzyme S subunit